MIILMGLGNIGINGMDSHYSLTRHSIGERFIRYIVHHFNATPMTNKFSLLLWKINFSNKDIPLPSPIIMGIPKTYMNNSGIPIAKFMHFYKYPLPSLFVFHDDIDLPFGKIKVKQGGGNAGHNGLKSLDAYMGKNYYRIRIGINHPRNISHNPSKPVSSYVLESFTKEEEHAISPLFHKMLQALPSLFTLPPNISIFMNNTSL